MATTPRSDVPVRLLAGGPSRQAFVLLRTVFTVAPVLFGLDKFTNLLIIGDYYDIALRDFGLLVGALALARLALDHDRRRHRRPTR